MLDLDVASGEFVKKQRRHVGGDGHGRALTDALTLGRAGHRLSALGAFGPALQPVIELR